MLKVMPDKEEEAKERAKKATFWLDMRTSAAKSGIRTSSVCGERLSKASKIDTVVMMDILLAGKVGEYEERLSTLSLKQKIEVMEGVQLEVDKEEQQATLRLEQLSREVPYQEYRKKRAATATANLSLVMNKIEAKCEAFLESVPEVKAFLDRPKGSNSDLTDKKLTDSTDNHEHQQITPGQGFDHSSSGATN